MVNLKRRLVLHGILLGTLISGAAGCDLDIADSREEVASPEPPQLTGTWVSTGPDTLYLLTDSAAGHCVLGRVEIVLGSPGTISRPGSSSSDTRYLADRSAFSLACRGAEASALEVFSIADSVFSFGADTTSVTLGRVPCNAVAGPCNTEPRWILGFTYAASLDFFTVVGTAALNEIRGGALWGWEDPMTGLRAAGTTVFRREGQP